MGIAEARLGAQAVPRQRPGGPPHLTGPGQREEKASGVKPAYSRLWPQGGVSGQRRARRSFPSWVLLMAADGLQGCSLFSSGKGVISYFPRISRKFQNKNKRREENRFFCDLKVLELSQKSLGKTSLPKVILVFWDTAGRQFPTWSLPCMGQGAKCYLLRNVKSEIDMKSTDTENWARR